jgi:hypothetical protein
LSPPILLSGRTSHKPAAHENRAAFGFAQKTVRRIVESL